MVLTLWLIELLLIIIFIRYVWSRREIYYLSWKLPGPIAFPLIGNALIYFCKEEEIFERTVNFINKYPSPMRFWLGPKFAMIFTELDQVEKIMCSMKFVNKDEIYRFLQVFIGEGLISGSGSKWKRDRKLMSPMFQKKIIHDYFPYVINHSKILIEKLKVEVDKPTFNIEKYMHRCSTDFVSESMIGIKTDAQNGSLDGFLNTVSRMYVLIHARIVKAWLHFEWIFQLTHYCKEQEDGKMKVHDFFRNALQTTEKKRLYENKNGDPPKSTLDFMLDIRDEVLEFANEEQLVHHLSTFYTASEDTITTITSFTLVLLGMYPEIQNKVAEELFEVLGRNNRDLVLKDLDELKYLEMCVKDVLRLFPIAPFIMRVPSENYKLDKWYIPKGCSVIVSIFNIHRDPKHWEKPNEFYPEHFLPEAVNTRHPLAFLAFSTGLRGCLGKPYAYMAMLTILATMLRNFVIEADGKFEDLKIKTDISIRSKNDYYPIRLKMRK